MLFDDAFLDPPSILRRLIDAFVEASRDFRRSPKEYIASAFQDNTPGAKRRKQLLLFGLAIGFTSFAAFMVAIILLPVLFARSQANGLPVDLEVHMINPDDFKAQQIEMPKADKKAGGGGGGGRNTPTPASKGQLPKFSLAPPLIAPRPEPTPRPPSLPVMETVQVDPRLEKPRDDLAVTGLPNGVPGPPSAGPGSDGGMGTGSKGGMGSGKGTGFGPGEGFNTGGGGPRLGGGSGAPATSVDQKPIPLNLPQPLYTEEARKNKITGTVRARVLIGADGLVKQVKIERGLPDGLNEQAIQAVYKVRFRPAMKSGQPVAWWVPFEIDFNLR